MLRMRENHASRRAGVEAAQSHREVNAEGRMQNDERPGKATSCDINATSRPVDSQLIATLRPL
jgi:hypothetical protein